MPFGFKSSQATVRRLMNSMLIEVQGISAFVYLDGIVCFGSSLNDYNKKLEQIFKCLKKFNLKLKLTKYEFLCKEVTYYI